MKTSKLCLLLNLCLILGFALLSLSVSGEDADVCDNEGVCEQPSNDERDVSPESSEVFLPPPEGICDEIVGLYGNGGSAQAYKPDAPVSSVVCREDLTNEVKYKAASWPFTRRTTRKGSAPALEVSLRIISCGSSDCSCRVLQGASASASVEVWQTLPDGRYSSLQPSAASDCRAQVPLSKEGIAHFDTIAPGSTGLMCGLGPGGWDNSPYGPPVIHFLVTAEGHQPLLADLPIVPHPKTLEQRDFSIFDWRGVNLVSKKSKSKPFRITNWLPDIENNRIKVDVDIFLQQSSEDKLSLCQSMVYGLPGSFFLEPIALCSPPTLDFFSV